MKPIFAIIAAAALAGCASQSDQVPASYIPAQTYAALSCEQMHAEAVSLSAKARSLGAVQDRKAGSDAAMTAVTLVLFWPAIFFISGDDANAAELAEVKGRSDALKTAAEMRGCAIK